MERRIFNASLDLLLAHWPNTEMSAERRATYWAGLADLDAGLLTAAVERCLRTCTFFPVVAEIRTAAEEILTACGLMPLEPEPAWERVMRAARHWSPYGVAVDFGDECIARAVAELGGIGRIAHAADDDLPFLRNDFLRRYGVYRRRAIEASQLPAAPAASAAALAE